MPDPGGCLECRSFAIVGMREMAAILLDGHHPDCPSGGGRRRDDYATISDLCERVERLIGERDAAIRALRDLAFPRYADAAGDIAEIAGMGRADVAGILARGGGGG